MKVICINPDGWEYTRTKWLIFKRTIEIGGPVEGDICTVTGKHFGEGGLMYYDLAEWPNDPNGDGYESTLFAPIPHQFNAVSYSKIEEETLISSN